MRRPYCLQYLYFNHDFRAGDDHIIVILGRDDNADCDHHDQGDDDDREDLISTCSSAENWAV